MPRIILYILAALALCCPTKSSAQHSIEVQRLAAKGDYYQALLVYGRMAKRSATSECHIAVAKSAWALGLMDQAAEEFDIALRDDSLPQLDRARLLLSRGIMEFQEGRHQSSNVFAGRAIELLSEPTSLRARVWLLWAQNLQSLGQFGAAEEKYLKALEESSEDDKPSIHYNLGLCRMRLGKTEEAGANFENIPISDPNAAGAVRYLARIALEKEDFPKAQFWLETGRREFPDSFLDSWVDYAMLRIAISEVSEEKVREIRAAAASKYPPSDEWLNLLDAAAEEFEWRENSQVQANLETSRSVGAEASDVAEKASMSWPKEDKAAAHAPTQSAPETVKNAPEPAKKEIREIAADKEKER
jgi:tetratricopeptide (TPR) repeat protein